jgi:hypothetical protein
LVWLGCDPSACPSAHTVPCPAVLQIHVRGDVFCGSTAPVPPTLASPLSCLATVLALEPVMGLARFCVKDASVIHNTCTTQLPHEVLSPPHTPAASG